jgi:hypothetical protein
MPDEYTPMTEQVRDGYDLSALRLRGSRDGDEEFDRWLRAHDSEVAVKALRRLAADLPTLAGWNIYEDDTIRLVQKRIRDRADLLDETKEGR